MSLNHYHPDDSLLSQPLLILSMFFFMFFMFFMGESVQEEFGWRGFALPRLMIRRTPFMSALILGLIWGFWHLPLFFISSLSQTYMNFEILKSAARTLKPDGKFIFTTLNGLFPIFHSLQKFYGEETKDDDATYHDNTFDIMTFREYNIMVFEDDDDNKHELTCNERFYIPSEITWLLNVLNFKKIEFFSAKPGEFSQYVPLTPDDFEMLVIASKSY